MRAHAHPRHENHAPDHTRMASQDFGPWKLRGVEVVMYGRNRPNPVAPTAFTFSRKQPFFGGRPFIRVAEAACNGV
jgi:hypothetical protein